LIFRSILGFWFILQTDIVPNVLCHGRVCNGIRLSTCTSSMRTSLASVILLITDQFCSVLKMKLRDGRVISEDDDTRLESTRISLDWSPTKGQQI
jgi:hypothetical protein